MIKGITERTDGRFVKTISFNNCRYYIYGKTRTECQNNYFKLKKKLKNNTVEVNKIITLNDWLKEWYELYKKPFVKLNTQQDIENILYNHIASFGSIKLNLLNSTYLQQKLNKIENSRTKEKINLYLNVALKKAHALNKIKINPYEQIVLPKKLNNIRDPFTYEEQVRILKRLEHEEIKPIILFYLVTGLRKQELNIKNILEDINFENKILKAINLKQHDFKTHYKYIDLSDEAINLIINNKTVFKKYSIEGVYRKFKEILNELNISGAIHTLRHTFATNHFYLGTQDKHISDWLGHSTIVITKDIYTKIDRSITKEKIHKLYNNLYFEV